MGQSLSKRREITEGILEHPKREIMKKYRNN
jgi:hypothetical protein